MRSRIAPILLCILAFWAGPTIQCPSQAAEWSLDPSIRLRIEYNDNIELAPVGGASAGGVVVSPDVRFGGATETLMVTGGVNVSINRYPDQPEFNTDNYAFTLRSRWRTEKDVVTVDVDAIRDSTLVTELETTGAVLAFRQRNSVNFNPSWSRHLTDTTLIEARYSYRAANYEDTSGTQLTDYRDHTASLGARRALDERSLVSVTAFYDLYETDPATFRARTYGVQAGYERAFSETLRAGLTAGVRRTQGRTSSDTLVCEGFILLGMCVGTVTEVTTVFQDESTGYTLDAFLEQRSERTTVTGRISRQINPSGAGSLVQTDRIAIVWNWQWMSNLTVSVDAAAYQTGYVGSLVTGSDSRYYRIEPRLSWRLTEETALNAGYSYARQKYESAPVSATANLVYVSVIYQWPKVTVSR